MKAKLRDYFERQQYEPWPERLLDLPKSALVIRGFELDGVTYRGTLDTEEIEYVPVLGLPGKTRGKISREQLRRPPETVTAAGSVVKKLREKRLVQLIPPTSGQYDSAGSPWDTFALGGSKRGFRPWDLPDDSVRYAPMPEDEVEFADLWEPVRRWPRPEIFYLQWKWCWGWTLTNDPKNVQAGKYGIDLVGYNQEQHTAMVSGAY
jgi:hypothetical protein